METSSRRFGKTQYLIFYNAVSAVLWFGVLAQVLYYVPTVGFQNVYKHMGGYVQAVQSLALLECVHALFGIVRARIVTTLMQVASRILVVWLVAPVSPRETTPSPFTSSMLVAWSVTEVIRYSYFVGLLQGRVPAFLNWLRYNTFFVLYPIGITSELVLIWKAIAPAQRWWAPYAWFLIGNFVIYFPSAYVLYTHMMKQRRAQMKGKKPERAVR